MYLAVSLLVAVVSQQARGSPIHFPDELDIDNNGGDAPLSPRVYIRKSVLVMMFFGDIETEDWSSPIMNNSDKLEKVGETVEASDHELEYLENKQINETSFPSLVGEVNSETLNNNNSNRGNEGNIHITKMDIVTEADPLNIETHAVNEAMGKSVDFDSGGNAENVFIDDEVGRSSDIVFFGDEIRRPENIGGLFTTERIPVHPDPFEGPMKALNNPASRPCDIEGYIHYQGECYEILSTGPCGEDKWLVMKGYNYAECEARKCALGKLFYEDKCVNLEDSAICGKGQMLFVESTGIAFCDCDPDYIYFQRDGTCIAENEQGWCPWGEYLVRNVDGNPECKPNPCGISGSVYHENTRRCYKKNYAGICKQGNIEIKGNEAECMEGQFDDSRNVFEVPTLRRCPKGSKRDLLHECRRRFNMPSIPSVLKARHLYGGCSPGWTKAPGGKCKQIRNLFAGRK